MISRRRRVGHREADVIVGGEVAFARVGVVGGSEQPVVVGAQRVRPRLVRPVHERAVDKGRNLVQLQHNSLVAGKCVNKATGLRTQARRKRSGIHPEMRLGRGKKSDLPPTV